jgi:pimeloyl-ACP methyl ester carboxylesterase
MALATLIVVAAAAAGILAAKEVQYECTNLTIPVGVTDVPVVETNLTITNGYEAIAFANAVVRRGAPMPQPKLTNLTKTFNISAQYCSPTSVMSSTIQLLTHGIGFDSAYWSYRPTNAPNNTEYDYIYSAMQAGYSTFAYDRLGIAPSTIANPITEVQDLVELALLANLTTMVKNGSIPHVPQPQKVLHVGHSYGSQLTNALAATSPSLVEGAILTGYSHLLDYQTETLAAFQVHLASQNQPKRFPASRYSGGYLTWPDVYAFRFSFLDYPHFNKSVAVDVEARKQPFTAGWLIEGSLLPVNATKFAGPVMYIVGSNDLIFCGGNCTTLLNSTSLAVESYSSSSDVTTYIQPNTGHAINVHYNATGAYEVMLDWAKGHGF